MFTSIRFSSIAGAAPVALCAFALGSGSIAQPAQAYQLRAGSVHPMRTGSSMRVRPDANCPAAPAGWAPAGNILLDGDFNTAVDPGGTFTTYFGPGPLSTSNWRVLSNKNVDLVDSAYWGSPSPGGVCTVDLDGTPGDGGIFETLMTIPATAYDVRLLLSGSAPQPGTNYVKVIVPGASVNLFYFTFAGHDVYAGEYDPYCWTFTARKKKTKLTIKSLDPKPLTNSDGGIVTDISVAPSNGCQPFGSTRSRFSHSVR
jgi:Protein of unknown function (DUF642)